MNPVYGWRVRQICTWRGYGCCQVNPISLKNVMKENYTTCLFVWVLWHINLCSIWPIDRAQTGATTLGQSGPGSNGNEGVIHIPQSSSNTGISLSDLFRVVTRTLIEGSYNFGEVQSVYSTASADWAIHCMVIK